MPKGKQSKQPRESERLDFQFVIRINRKVWGKKDPEKLRRAVEQAKTNFIEDSDPDSIEGIHVIGRWRNPHNKNPRHADWKTSDDPDQSVSGYVRTILERTGRH